MRILARIRVEYRRTILSNAFLNKYPEIDVNSSKTDNKRIEW